MQQKYPSEPFFLLQCSPRARPHFKMPAPARKTFLMDHAGLGSFKLAVAAVTPRRSLGPFQRPAFAAMVVTVAARCQGPGPLGQPGSRRTGMPGAARLPSQSCMIMAPRAGPSTTWQLELFIHSSQDSESFGPGPSACLASP